MSYRRILIALVCMMFCFEVAVYAQPRVKAVAGDGIYSLLRRYDIPLSSATIEQFIELNKDRIGEDRRIYTGVEYLLPVIKRQAVASADSTVVSTPPQPEVLSDSIADVVEIPKVEVPPLEEEKESEEEMTGPKETVREAVFTGPFPIFGEEHKMVERRDSVLSGCYYYLMAGHGGPDPGAVSQISNIEVAEDEYAYDVTLRLARHLISRGAVVYLITRDPNDGIRDDKILAIDYDEKCYPNLGIPRGQRARLRQRSNAVNKLYRKRKNVFQQVLSIHVDSRSVGENIDVFFYHNKGSDKGRQLANDMQDVFREKYERFQPGRGYVGTVGARTLYVLKNTVPTAVFVELGNIRNKADQRRIVLSNNREALANWMAQGMVRNYLRWKKSQ